MIKTIITEKEYDKDGNLIREIITEETNDNNKVYGSNGYPYFPNYPIREFGKITCGGGCGSSGNGGCSGDGGGGNKYSRNQGGF